MPPRLAVLAALALALAGPGGARAHEVEEEVERRGQGWAVRLRIHGGRPLAGAAYQVLRPGTPPRLVREGTTPPDGWVELAPDVPGAWAVKIADPTGHGRTVKVVVPADAAATPSPTPTPNATTTTTTATTGGRASPLRIAAGAATLLVLFLAVARLRRRGPVR